MTSPVAAPEPRPAGQDAPEDPLNSRTTALLISNADGVSVVMVAVIELTKITSAADLRRLPLLFVTIGAIAILCRLVALQVLTEGWKAIVRAGIRTFDHGTDIAKTGVSGRTSPPRVPRPVPAELKTDVSRVAAHRTWWFALLGLGMLAQLLLVAGSGGLVESPFTELLVATFVLGQFRSPTGATIWTLFALGVASAVGAQLIFLVLEHKYRARVEELHWGTWAHVVPLLLVGFMSTFVSYFLRKSEDERTEPSSTDPAFQNVGGPNKRNSPTEFLVTPVGPTTALTDTATEFDSNESYVLGSETQMMINHGTQSEPTPPAHAVLALHPGTSLCGRLVVTWPELTFPPADTVVMPVCDQCTEMTTTNTTTPR